MRARTCVCAPLKHGHRRVQFSVQVLYNFLFQFSIFCAATPLIVRPPCTCVQTHTTPLPSTGTQETHTLLHTHTHTHTQGVTHTHTHTQYTHNFTITHTQFQYTLSIFCAVLCARVRACVHPLSTGTRRVIKSLQLQFSIFCAVLCARVRACVRAYLTPLKHGHKESSIFCTRYFTIFVSSICNLPPGATPPPRRPPTPPPLPGGCTFSVLCEGGGTRRVTCVCACLLKHGHFTISIFNFLCCAVRARTCVCAPLKHGHNARTCVCAPLNEL